MRRALALVVLALGLAGCASDEEISPPPTERLEAPELSVPREPRKTGDPTPPIRERLHQVEPLTFNPPRSEAHPIVPVEAAPTPPSVVR